MALLPRPRSRRKSQAGPRLRPGYPPNREILVFSTVSPLFQTGLINFSIDFADDLQVSLASGKCAPQDPLQSTKSLPKAARHEKWRGECHESRHPTFEHQPFSSPRGICSIGAGITYFVRLWCYEFYRQQLRTFLFGSRAPVV